MSGDADTATERQIRPLDETTIQRIAAGEVVERPASVVKELVENSLDADATRVSVAVENGGIEGVRVRDDGVGMTADELELAVEEHTTSKIAGIDDLEAGVGTLGFRGEALHTIGAVSRMTVRSRPRDGDGGGAELTVEGGDAGDVRPAGCPPGTVVEVDDLFFNTPARKKFLKTEATEFDHVNTVVTHYALANPDVAVSLEHNGREVFATEGRGDLESTILSVYGREVAESMVRVDADADGPVESLTGLVSHPETTRSSRDYLSTFVNGRYVRSGVLREAVLDAYGGQLASDRYPFAVLFVSVPADAVDVNVHPRKMEVRFDAEDAVKGAIADAVRDALLDHGLVRSTAPRGRSAPDETAVSPVRDETTVAAGGDETSADRGDDTDGRQRPDTAQTDASPESASADPSGHPPPPSSPSSTPSSAASTSQSSPSSSPSSSSPSSSPSSRASSTPASARATQSSFDVDDESSSAADDSPSPSASGGFSAPTRQQTLTGEDATPEREFDHLPTMRVLGQLYDTYLVAETPEGLILVDQHAADERVNYERLRDETAGDTPTQALADAVELELTAREAALFEEYRDALARVGFHATRTGERTVEVRTVPAVVDSTLDPELLRDALTGFVDADDAETVDSVVDSLLADLACYPSITGNTSLHEGSVVDLLSALDECENPYACPHGRPVFIRFDRDEIEDRFERDYPGHAGRRAE